MRTRGPKGRSSSPTQASVSGPALRAAPLARQQVQPAPADPEAQLRRAEILGHRPAGPQPGRDAASTSPATLPGPAVQRAPEIAATDAAMGQRVVDQVTALNGPRTASTGVHYAHNYQANARRYQPAQAATAAYKPYADFWKEEYWSGYADPTYFDRIGHMSWRLKPLKSAAAAIKSWLAGPTIAECASALVAIETDTLRAAIGDDKFDAKFSEYDLLTGDLDRLLTVNQYTSRSSVGAYMGGTDEPLWSAFGLDTPNSRSVEKGEWYYFYNHPQYLLKHPGGAFQGENAICMDATPGSQKWAGFGVPSVSETDMMNTMAAAYNAARTERDFQVLLERHAPAVAAQKTGANTYAGLYGALPDLSVIPDEYRADKGIFPTAAIDAAAILAAAEYTIDGVKRKGGFVSGAGKRLAATKVAAART